MKKKVIAAGHICLDITPVFRSENNYNLSDILSPESLSTRMQQISIQVAAQPTQDWQ